MAADSVAVMAADSVAEEMEAKIFRKFGLMFLAD
jgi:hypothetical protein